MTDREALAAALELEDLYLNYLIEKGFTLDNGNMRQVWVAARERLAQLPEKCEHGESASHWPVFWTKECPGKKYPPALVERIAEHLVEVIEHFNEVDVADIVVAVLDALKDWKPE